MALSQMQTTMEGQADRLAAVLADDGPPARAAERLAGRRVWLCGTGTSWHAANHGAWLLHAAGVDAIAIQAADAASGGPGPGPGDGLVLLSHTGAKREAAAVLGRARGQQVECVVVGAAGREDVDLTTVERERSSAYTASHTAALLRLAQLAVAAGADLGPLDRVPEAVGAVLAGEGPAIEPPQRLLELTGAGANQWTAAEGALKVREAARIATQGLAAEQLLHGPAVALDHGDTLVVLDGGGPAAGRLADVGRAAEGNGARVHRIAHHELGEPLSIFPLTAAVQRIALECARARGTNPDKFGYDVPGRREVWEAIEL